MRKTERKCRGDAVQQVQGNKNKNKNKNNSQQQSNTSEELRTLYRVLLTETMPSH